MGLYRNGARTFLFLMQKACKLSRLPGFQLGLQSILGPDQAASVLALWEPLCAFIDTLVALDNWYNQKDAAGDTGDGEDYEPAP